MLNDYLVQELVDSSVPFGICIRKLSFIPQISMLHIYNKLFCICIIIMTVSSFFAFLFCFFAFLLLSTKWPNSFLVHLELLLVMAILLSLVKCIWLLTMCIAYWYYGIFFHANIAASMPSNEVWVKVDPHRINSLCDTFV